MAAAWRNMSSIVFHISIKGGGPLQQDYYHYLSFIAYNITLGTDHCLLAQSTHSVRVPISFGSFWENCTMNWMQARIQDGATCHQLFPGGGGIFCNFSFISKCQWNDAACVSLSGIFQLFQVCTMYIVHVQNYLKKYRIAEQAISGVGNMSQVLWPFLNLCRRQLFKYAPYYARPMHQEGEESENLQDTGEECKNRCL